jgi:hypothetical protein
VLGVVVICGEVCICGVGGNVCWFVVVIMGDGVVGDVVVVVGGWLCEVGSFVGEVDVG